MEFRQEEVEGVEVIHCSGVLDAKEGGGVDAQVKSWLLSQKDIFVFDFKNVTDVKPSMYRHLLLFHQSLKPVSKHMFFMNAKPTIITQMRADGLTSVVVSVASIEEAKKRGAPARGAVDVEFINPFILATRNVLEMQAQTPLTPGKAYLRKPTERIPMEIAGVIGVNSSEFTGTISICFRAEVFLKIYENMVGEKHASISREIEDAAGELLNIIFGQAKTVLNDSKGYNLDKSIPTILVGDKLKLHHQSRTPSIVVPFESNAGAFHLEILIDRTK